MVGIEELEAPGADAFRAILRRKRPVLLHGVIDHWPALTEWSLDSLSTAAGHRQVRVTHSQGGIYDSPSYVEMTLREFLRVVAGGDRRQGQYYITGIELEQHLPELAGDVDTPGLLAPLDIELRHFFLGRDTVTGCHFHPNHQNLLTQLIGRKTVILYSPADFSRLYPKPWNDRFFNWSRVGDLRNYDRAQFPEVGKATAFAVTLEPGMALHIPVHWWHFVHGEGISASLAFFWRAPIGQWSFPHPGLRSAVRAATNRARKLLPRNPSQERSK